MTSVECFVTSSNRSSLLSSTATKAKDELLAAPANLTSVKTAPTDNHMTLSGAAAATVQSSTFASAVLELSLEPKVTVQA